MRLRRACGLTLELLFALGEAGASEGALSAGMGGRAENFFKTPPRVACPTNLGLKQGKQRELRVPLLTLWQVLFAFHPTAMEGWELFRQRACRVGFFLEQKL